MEIKRYTIEGEEYFQKPLVLGQIKQLYDLFSMMDELPRLATDFTTLLDMFGDKASLFLAVALTPKGMKPRDKDIHELAVKLEDTPLETAAEVAEDFLSLQDVTSTFRRIATLSEKISSLAVMGANTAEGGPGIASSTPSPVETSPDETESSGA